MKQKVCTKVQIFQMKSKEFPPPPINIYYIFLTRYVFSICNKSFVQAIPYNQIRRKCVKTKYPLLIFTKLLLSQAEALICPKVFVALDTDLSLWQNALFEIATQLLGAFPLSVLMRIFPSMILSVSSKSTIGRTTTRKLQGRDWPRKRDARIGGQKWFSDR